MLAGGERRKRKAKPKKPTRAKLNVKGKLKSAELAAAMWGDMSAISKSNAAEEARLAKLKAERREEMRIQAEMRAQKEAERDAYRKKMEELAQRRKWEQIHRKKLEDERLASIQVAKVPTPPKEKKKRGGQSSLFSGNKAAQRV